MHAIVVACKGFAMYRGQPTPMEWPPQEMEQLRHAGGDLTVLLKEGLEIKLDTLVGRND